MPIPALAPEQAALADRDDLLAATGQRAHDRGAAADVGVAADHHAGGDPALDHRGAERAGVVVDEALVHHRGAGGQVGAQPDPVGVGDPYAGRQHVVDHPRELVHPEHGDVAVPGAQPGADRLEALHRARPAEVHTTLGRQPKMPSRLIVRGATSRWLSRCSRRYASGGAGRGRVEVDLDHGGSVRTARSSSRRCAATAPPARPRRSRAQRRGRGSRCRARRRVSCTVASPQPQAERVAPTAGSVMAREPTGQDRATTVRDVSAQCP